MDPKLRRYKQDLNFSYSIGVFPTLELLEKHPEEVLKIVLSSKGEKNQGVEKIKQAALSRKIPTDINDRLIEILSTAGNCYALGVFRKYSSSPIEGQNQVVLFNPSDMGNLGTIIRTMVSFGVFNLILIEPAVDIFDPKVIRSSMGAMFQVHFEYFKSFAGYRRKYQVNLYPFITDGKDDLKGISFRKPFALVFGSEGAGLPKEYLSLETSVRISHQNTVDSLNLSVAVGIALYQSYL